VSEERGQAPSMSLPDALAGLHRPSGTPDTLYERSKDFSKAAAQLDDICGDFVKLLLRVPGPWTGTSQSEFTQVMTGKPGNYRDIAAGYRKAGLTLKAYASALEHAQQAWDSSRQLADADWHRQIGHGIATPPDPFSPDRIRARRQVEVALAKLRAAAAHTRSVLSSLEFTMGKRPPVKPEIDRGRVAAAFQAWDEVWGMAKHDAKDIWDLHRLFVRSQAKDAWKQKWEDFYSDKTGACSDPAGYIKENTYDAANGDEFLAGNDARWLAGLAYNAVGPRKYLDLLKPSRKPDEETKDKSKSDEEKKKERDVCHPLG